ncbi:AAA family ATPase [Campylobacter concisus]|uniref:AAA family ATPase n=1 Tax=Campylobacter concisus TaxID=199 RepID=UPI00092A8E10|nr:AAA family ATPase [Campylobacter concisus]OJJ27995.1 bacteriocin [Campylobacter concisus]
MSENIKKLEEFLSSNNITGSALARAIGVSPSLISQLRAGSYKGDNDAINAKINAYINNFNKKAKNFHANAKENEFYVTSDVKMANFIISEAIAEKEIGLIYGFAGSGKTTALKEFARTNPNVVLIEATCHTSAKVLLEDLCEALKIDATGGLNTKLKAVARFLKSSDKVIMVDEAEHLPLKALEDLRRIYDFSRTPLILCGTEILLKNLMGKNKELRQLFSRICGKWCMQGLSKDESEKIYTKEIFPYCKGNFRSSAKLYKKALRLAELNGCLVDESVVARALDMVILG